MISHLGQVIHSDVMKSVRALPAIIILLTTSAVADEKANPDNFITNEKRAQSRIEHFTPDSVRIITHSSYAFTFLGYRDTKIDKRIELMNSNLNARFQELKALFASSVAQKALASCAAYRRQPRFIGFDVDLYDMSITDHAAQKPMEDAQVKETYVLSHMFACVNDS